MLTGCHMQLVGKKERNCRQIVNNNKVILPFCVKFSKIFSYDHENRKGCGIAWLMCCACVEAWKEGVHYSDPDYFINVTITSRRLSWSTAWSKFSIHYSPGNTNFERFRVWRLIPSKLACGENYEFYIITSKIASMLWQF